MIPAEFDIKDQIDTCNTCKIILDKNFIINQHFGQTKKIIISFSHF